MSAAGDEETVLALDDPRVPEAIRRHAARFKTPVRYVVVSGPDYVLIAEDGEVVDFCALDG
ncbi:MAG: hypothetical protein E6R07_07750 [Nevskiaceae bacterium]|nr:MAG: hypothetical protein E6R07_07750 [Nevskiaceae bacterium]